MFVIVKQFDKRGHDMNGRKAEAEGIANAMRERREKQEEERSGMEDISVSSEDQHISKKVRFTQLFILNCW